MVREQEAVEPGGGMELHIATLYLISSAVLLLSAVASWRVWSRHRDNPWLLCWSLATGFSACSLVPLGLYEAEPPAAVAAGSVVLLMAGYALAWESMRLLNGRQPMRGRLVLLVVLFALVFGACASIGATSAQLAALASAALAVTAALSALEALRVTDDFLRNRLAIAVLFGVMAAVMGARAGMTWLAPAVAAAQSFQDPLNGLSPLVKTACVIGLSISLMMIANERVTDRHQRLALTDELTGLPNRRYFLARANWLARRSLRRGRPACVLMMDLDHFSKLNEAFGHAGGDQALEAFAALLRQMIRDGDFAARYGGEEFCAYLSDTERAHAVRFAQQICARVAAESLDIQGHAYRLTVSIGVGSVDDGDIDRALQRADAALYVAKAQGRNQAVSEEAMSARARA
jgi:diguanylate cyclase (GGDEF)-like protein